MFIIIISVINCQSIVNKSWYSPKAQKVDISYCTFNFIGFKFTLINIWNHLTGVQPALSFTGNHMADEYPNNSMMKSWHKIQTDVAGILQIIQNWRGWTTFWKLLGSFFGGLWFGLSSLSRFLIEYEWPISVNLWKAQLDDRRV